MVQPWNIRVETSSLGAAEPGAEARCPIASILLLFFRRRRYHSTAAAPQTPVIWNISNKLGLPCAVLGYLCCKKLMTAWLWLASLLADEELSLVYLPGKSPAASTVVRVRKSRKMKHKSWSELVILRVCR
jgi:positive regulator of sigma E activity